MNTAEFTIGRLARAAGVNIETIRYYQRRSLLPVPQPTDSAFRTYPLALVDRIRFIRRAQELGFSLDEIATLLRLENGTQRKAIRKVAGDRLAEIREKLTDLRKMEKALAHLIEECEATGHVHPCPIIATLTGERVDAASQAPRNRQASGRASREVA